MGQCLGGNEYGRARTDNGKRSGRRVERAGSGRGRETLFEYATFCVLIYRDKQRFRVEGAAGGHALSGEHQVAACRGGDEKGRRRKGKRRTRHSRHNPTGRAHSACVEKGGESNNRARPFPAPVPRPMSCRVPGRPASLPAPTHDHQKCPVSPITH